ncbi:MAG: alanine dehydrogenase [Candidatus Binatia bacterium]|nr:alanine dehydrogenase [Candidatus Binatia bacterium]
MRFAIPRETGYGTDIVEHRVALSPAGVRELCHAGAEIIVQSGAGQGAGFLDEEYRAAGAQVVYAAQEVYRRADVLLRVERPREEEWLWLAEGTTVIGFLHVHTIPPSLLPSLQQRRLTLVGLEVVRADDGSFPLQKVSSQIAGRLAPQLAGRLLTVPGGGTGVLLSGLPGIPPADVVILGAGVLGGEATRAFLGAGASVYVLDIDVQKLERLDHLCAGRVVTALATRRNIEKFASFAEVLVGAVRISGGSAPVLVTRSMVQRMKRGAVILDFAINEGGCVATSRPTPLEGTFVQDGVVHYAPPNVPSLVPRTATYALTQALLPYLHLILREGVSQAVQQHAPLARGVYMLDGHLTQLYTGEEPGQPTPES